MSDTRLIQIGHSPDPDDAFMFYALSTGKVEIPGCRIEHRLLDIETLNRKAAAGEYEMTAISAHAYPALADKYQVMMTGSSMGRGYGPIVVALKEGTLGDFAGARIAIPGEQTTAHLLLKLHLPEFEKVIVPFDEIMDQVIAKKVDAGVLIHEGQLTWTDTPLRKICDFGTMWEEATGGLPLPLGLDAVRRDLGPELIAALAKGLRESIEYAYAHEDDAMEYARGFGRGIEPDVNRKFVRMYVNDDTRDMGEPGVKALTHLFKHAVERKLIPGMPPMDFIPA